MARSAPSPLGAAPTGALCAGEAEAPGTDDVQQLLERAWVKHQSEVAHLERKMHRLRFELSAARAGVWLQRGGEGETHMKGTLTTAGEDKRTAVHLIDPPSSGRSSTGLCCAASLPTSPAGHHVECLSPVVQRSSDLSLLPEGQVSSSSLGGSRAQVSLSRTVSMSSRTWRRRPSDSMGNIQTETGFRRVVNHPVFEGIVAAMIALNGLVIAAEAQYAGFDLAQQARHRSASGSSVENWPHAVQVFEVLQWIFGVFFLIEIIIRIAALRRDFLFEVWNWIDLTLVILWAWSHILQHSSNPSLVRIARLARVVRPVKLIKHMNSHHFDSLYLITVSLQGSITILTWTFLFLLVVHMMLALMINQLLREIYFDSADREQQEMVYEYYGSFSRAFLTMFEISLANWPESCRVLVEDVHELFIIYALLHKMILGFAAVGVVNAVFTQETFKVATLDDGVMVAQTRRRQRAHRQKMETLFKEADLNADGFITIDEWEEICKDDWVQAWLGAQGIESHDTKGLFDLLASDDGTMTAEELVRGTEKLQGAAAIMGVIQRIIDIKRELKHVTGKIEISSAKL